MSEYPMAMVHPGHQPAVVARPTPGKPLLPGENPRAAKAAVFPPVTVSNEDQEGQHRAMGYVAQGEILHDYVPVEYPKWVGDVLVNTAEEERALKKKAKVSA